MKGNNNDRRQQPFHFWKSIKVTMLMRMMMMDGWTPADEELPCPPQHAIEHNEDRKSELKT